MRLFFSKLGFVHRHLWSRNRLYQASILAGTAPLVGGLLAAAIWVASHGGFGGRHQALPHWAKPEPQDVWKTAEGAPPVVQPSLPLPPIDDTGALAGYKPGWRMTTRQLDVNAGYEVNIDSTPLTAFSLEESKLDLARVITERPKVPLYVATGSSLLAIRTAGIYTLSLRFDRPAAQPADCLMRLGFGPHRVISNVEISIINDVSKTFDAARFDLQPGLYSIAWAFTCWHDHAVVAPGSLTLLIGHPGEQGLLPARADDIVQRDALKPSN
jgi:hypothetical protein